MKLDWTEIQKGVNEELEKSASLNKEAFAGRMAAEAVRLAGPAARLAGTATKKILAPVGNFLASHPKSTAFAGASTVPYLAEQYTPELHQKALEAGGFMGNTYSALNLPQRFVRGAGQAAGLAGDVVGKGSEAAGEAGKVLADMTGTESTPGKPGDGVTEHLQRAREGFGGLADKGIDAIKSFGNFFNNTKKQVGGLYDAANTGISSALSGMGDAGKYLPLGLGLLGGGLGGYLLSRKGNKQNDGYSRYPQSVVNINLGGRRRGGLLDYDDSGVGGLSSIKEGAITDSLASAVGRRMADKVLNNTVGAPGQERPQPQDPRELELTSKHPEIAEMLKNEQTKAYLEKLLKE